MYRTAALRNFQSERWVLAEENIVYLLRFGTNTGLILESWSLDTNIFDKKYVFVMPFFDGNQVALSS